MPLHFFGCDACGMETEEYRSIHQKASETAPSCWRCGQPTRWIVPVVAMDAKEPGSSRVVVHRQVPTREGLKIVREEVNTLHRIRQIERDSEQRYKDGEGEPLRFRAYANNGSNMDVNSFGREGKIGDRVYDSGSQPTKKSNISLKRHGENAPDVLVARHAGKSPLPD